MQPATDALAEEGEAPADQQCLEPCGLAGLHKALDARVELQMLGVDRFQGRDRHTTQQSQSPPQAVLVVADFATHGRFGDGGDLCLAPSSGCYLIDTFDVDQRGVHVKGHQLEIRQVKWRPEAAHKQPRLDLLGAHMSSFKG